MRFFRPDAVRICLLALFLLIAFFGWRESAAFTKEGTVPSTAFWTFWMALLAPLGALILLLDKGGLTIDLFHAPPAVFWAVQTIYFYVVACVIASLTRAVSRKITSATRQ